MPDTFSETSRAIFAKNVLAHYERGGSWDFSA